MPRALSSPISVRIDAFDGSHGVPVTGVIDPSAQPVRQFALSDSVQPAKAYLAPEVGPKLEDWKDPRVGWGLVVEEGLNPIPGPLNDLVQRRKAPIFRYRPNWEHSLAFLRDTKNGKDVSIASSPRGVTAGSLPYYLLIYGEPTRIPWRLQFILGANRCVGRIALAGKALENYVTALTNEFVDEQADPYTTLTWAVDHGPNDITRLMRDQIALKLDAAFAGDAEMRRNLIDGAAGSGRATVAELTRVLSECRPGFIATTSHGLTGPLNAPERMRGNLGLPVDQANSPLDVDALLNLWKPGGAIWYCHACCSAGSDAPSCFASLFDESSELRRVLDGIAALGPSIAPLPTRLLGAERPIRAFVGHVEPTFDWTLRNPLNGQPITKTLVSSFYPNLYQKEPTPIAFAMREWFGTQAPLFASWRATKDLYDGRPEIVQNLLVHQLAMRDIQSTVILGDPTTLLPLKR